ncbi:MAG: endolytic transglycosylase MltG [Brevinematia bacterium]
MNKKANLFFILSIVLLSILIIIIVSILISPSQREGKEYILIVEKGDSLHSIGEKLEKEGIISDKNLFVIIGKILGTDKKLVPSAYKVNSSMNIFQIHDLILNEKIYTIKVRIPEGATIYDIDRIFEEHGLTQKGDILREATNPELIRKYNLKLDRLEGFLFPATYDVPFYYKNKPQRIVEMMVNTFFKKINRDEYTEMAKRVGLTFEQAVILASIIEKEAGKPKEEKYLVSSVFHNRLKSRMYLGSCATVIYGLIDKNMWYNNNLKKWHLSYDTPYNTYIHLGLPKTPISNPSFESLKAAVMPANTDYLFFVSKNDGTHIFSKTYKEHEKYVYKYQIDYWKYRR